tara:strand:- start:888 stop:2948 length:2061 start_codon:yes stop_codon:yes gene_type:complete
MGKSTTSVFRKAVVAKKGCEEDLLTRINKRKAKLQTVGRKLKKHFVGLDEVIDKILSNMEVWYVMPELLTRPTIINLWGLTGVGKTDLVRRLVKALGINDSFVEVQLTNKGSSTDTYATSIQSILEYSNIETDKPGILLLDEIQRFRSVEKGEDIHDYKFQDVWMLLSDGRFSGDASNKDKIFQLILESMYWEDYEQTYRHNNKSEEEEGGDKKSKKRKEKVRTYKQSYFQSKRLKKMLRLEESIEEIMRWDSQKLNELIVDKIKDQSVYEGENYSRLLIFVSGNLDEAYSMSRDCAEVDIDADVFHDFSLTINLLTIKQALKSRFKPEQIARFGNVHVIYPSLSKSSYSSIIRRRIDSMVKDVKDKFDVSILVDRSIHRVIYKNGVFPAQGTRPVFSTISSFLDNTIPFFVLKSIENKVDKIKLSYNNKEKVIYSNINENTYKVKAEGEIDKIKAKQNIDKKLLVAVHEAGHAIAYSTLFNLIPTQLVASAASEDGSGFMGSHRIEQTRESSLATITVLMAGAMAEEIIFGKEYVTSGSHADRHRATQTASVMLRKWGMGDSLSTIASEHMSTAGGFDQLNYNIDDDNDNIENILRNQKEEARKILNNKLDMLQTLSDKLVKDGKIEPEDYKEICATFGIEAHVHDTKEIVSHGYHKEYKKFYGKRNKLFIVPNPKTGLVVLKKE